MSSSPKLPDQSSAPKYSNGSSERSNPLLNNGKNPGEDFPMIAFDDVLEAAPCRPALTSVATAPGKIGEASAGFLPERFSNPDRLMRRLIFKPELIVRESCAHVSANQKDHS
jgi:DNA-binding LacI/PurR family transcriptional regulator